MIESKIMTAGQTTIPLDVRNYLGVKDGDTVRYYLEEGRVVLVPIKASIRELKGFLPKPDQAVTLDEMDESIAEASAQTLNPS